MERKKRRRMMFPTLLTADAGRMQRSVNYPTTTCVLNTAICLINDLYQVLLGVHLSQRLIV